jgi:hypothetical protein
VVKKSSNGASRPTGSRVVKRRNKTWRLQAEHQDEEGGGERAKPAEPEKYICATNAKKYEHVTKPSMPCPRAHLAGEATGQTRQDAIPPRTGGLGCTLNKKGTGTSCVDHRGIRACGSEATRRAGETQGASQGTTNHGHAPPPPMQRNSKRGSSRQPGIHTVTASGTAGQ